MVLGQSVTMSDGKQGPTTLQCTLQSRSISQSLCSGCLPFKQCFGDPQDKEALQQQVALLKLASQDGVVAIQKQLADAVAERDVAEQQVKAAEQQAAAETAHRVRLEGSAHDVQQQLSRQTAEAAKAHQTCKKLQEQVRFCSATLGMGF